MLRSGVAVLVAALLAAGACSSSGSTDTSRAETLHPRWHAATLPMPAGPPGRVAVRDAASCGGHWYVVGAVVGPDGSSRPAAWTSADARTWRPMVLHPTDYYSRRAILYSVACRDGRVAAIGARSGGAHGNPRTATWRLRDDGVLQDVTAPFVLFGGEHAVSVNRIAAGAGGWLIAGDRSSGAAAWVAGPDATGFRIVDHDPALASDQSRTTSALDAVDDGTGWTLVGRAAVTGRIPQVPQAWVSGDGTDWTRQEVAPATRGFADLERVVRQGPGLLAVGIRDRRYGAWRRAGDHWAATGSFGRLAEGSTGAPFVSGLASTAARAVVAASDGAVFRLWAEGTDHTWRPVATPTQPRNNGDDQLTVAADEDTVLLLSDDGTSGRLWTTAWNTLDR